MFTLFRVEANIRKYSTAYVPDRSNHPDPTKFKIADWKHFEESGGSICFFKENGNAYHWLFIEILTFVGQFFGNFCRLVVEFFTDTLYTEAKNPDYIVCHDYRDHSGELDELGLPKRLENKKIYVFDTKMTQIWSEKGYKQDKFRWTYG